LQQRASCVRKLDALVGGFLSVQGRAQLPQVHFVAGDRGEKLIGLLEA